MSSNETFIQRVTKKHPLRFIARLRQKLTKLNENSRQYSCLEFLEILIGSHPRGRFVQKFVIFDPYVAFWQTLLTHYITQIPRSVCRLPVVGDVGARSLRRWLNFSAIFLHRINSLWTKKPGWCV